MQMRIDFYLIDAMEIDNYVPIWQALRKRGVNAQIVAVPGRKNTASKGWFDFDNAIRFLDEKNIPYTTTPDYHSAGAITTQHSDILSPYHGKKFRLMYGVSMPRDSFSNTECAASGFDGVLVHGPFSQSLVCQWKSKEEVPIIGYPKYDFFFRKEVNKKQISARLGLNNAQPILVYLPTWANNSSIDLFFPAIASLDHRYQFVVKLHHCTARMEPKRMKIIEDSKVKLVEGDYNISELYSIADLVIADVNSGAFAEAILTNPNRPLVGLNTNSEYLEVNNCPRLFDAAAICTNPAQLENLIDKVLLHDGHYTKRKQLRDELFSYKNGHAADKAAEAILNLLEKEHTNSSRYPVNTKIQCQICQGRNLVRRMTKKVLYLFSNMHSNLKYIYNKIFRGFDSNRHNIKKSVNWLKNNRVKAKGMSISNKKQVSYPEVTGYIIPTLYQWGEKELARNLTTWLITEQNKDGSFSAPDGTPYTFDAGQVVRGFVSVLDDMPEVEKPLRNACNWILTQIRPDGRLSTPSTKMWGKIADDRIHLYVLPPLIDAGKRLNEQKYIEAANKILKYYKLRKDLVEFNTLSHFYAYIIEALCDLGETDLAKKGMKQVQELQHKNGSIPAYKNVSWVCSTGVAQLALIWYKLGMNEPADKAMQYLEKIQNKTGGFNGSYGRKKNYFAKEEISWAVKFYLDAYHWKIKSTFDQTADNFSNEIDEKDGRVEEILSFFGDINNKKIIDVGCGKGRYLHILKSKFPKTKLYGMDISEQMLKFCPGDAEKKCGSILDIKYPDNYFDCVYSIEALEHTLMTENAIKEITRILKPNGKILIIDKNIEKLGKLKTEPWEQWFKAEKIVDLLQKNDVNANYNEISYGKHQQPDGLFIAWKGQKGN